jgi:transposase, IS5 family
MWTREHKPIRRYDQTDAKEHDRQKPDTLLNRANTSHNVFADSACRSIEVEAKLKVQG